MKNTHIVDDFHTALKSAIDSHQGIIKDFDVQIWPKINVEIIDMPQNHIATKFLGGVMVFPGVTNTQVGVIPNVQIGDIIPIQKLSGMCHTSPYHLFNDNDHNNVVKWARILPV